MPFDGNNPNLVQQTLVVARKLAEEGWCKDNLATIDMRGKKRYCVLGAIRMAIYGNPYNSVTRLEDPENWRLENKAIQALRCASSAFLKNTPIEKWNDMTSRRKGHVLAAFDRAITEAGYLNYGLGE